MAQILEYDTVRVVALHGSAESHVAFSESLRPPAIGDVGTVVHLTKPSGPRDPRTQYIVESGDGGAAMTWLAEFDADELEILSRPGSTLFLGRQPDVLELVARLLQQWLATATPHDIHRPYVELQHVLPLASDMGGFHGVTAAGEVLAFEWDKAEQGTVVTDERILHGAWFQAARKYPELRALLPERPPTAQICDICGGSGRPNLPEHLIDVMFCQCSGAGWLPSVATQSPGVADRRKKWWQFWRQ